MSDFIRVGRFTLNLDLVTVIEWLQNGQVKVWSADGNSYLLLEEEGERVLLSLAVRERMGRKP